MCSMIMDPPALHANHPFYFALIDKKLKTVLFNGRVFEPSTLK